MKQILIAGTALTLFAAPAHAQLLGGGGSFGGGIGGTIGGAAGAPGSIGSVGSLPTEAARGVVRGTADTSSDARGSAGVDRHSGRVEAGGQGSGSLRSGITGALDTPVSSTSGIRSTDASGSASGSTSAQLIGTDAVRSTAGSAAGQALGAGQASTQQAQATAQGLVGTAGSVAGSAQASTTGAASVPFNSLAAAGSLAAQAQGAFAVERGTAILDTRGERIGRVRDVVADARGEAQQLLVSVNGERALLPTGNFQVSGEALVSAMSKAQIEQVAQEQANDQ